MKRFLIAFAVFGLFYSMAGVQADEPEKVKVEKVCGSLGSIEITRAGQQRDGASNALSDTGAVSPEVPTKAGDNVSDLIRRKLDAVRCAKALGMEPY